MSNIIYRKPLHWDAGIKGGIPCVPVSANVLDFGARGDGITDDAPAFQHAIDSVTFPGAVLIPAGSYLIKSKLMLKNNIILRGHGPDRTQLLIHHSRYAFEISGCPKGPWVNLTGGYTEGSTALGAADPRAFAAEQYIEIQQDNNPAVMYTLPEWEQDWAAGAVGQIVRISGVSGNSITIEEPLRISYSKDFRPVVRICDFIEGVGFEDFDVKRIDTSDTNTFLFRHAASCWIKNIRSHLACKSHVHVEGSCRIEVRDSFFDDATDWGAGGHGYGVELGLHATDCLIENNIFKHLRHSMMVHVGSNGNVFGYNYSRDPYQNEGGDWTPCDISVHGHYAYANLFEGNVVQKITVSDYWGPSGPDNTYFRNRIESFDIQVEDSSYHQNFIGNEIALGKITVDIDPRYPHTIGEASLFVHGNYVNGALQWEADVPDHTVPASYYLSSKPGFYGSMAWPSTGSDRLDGTNPAKERYFSWNNTSIR